MKNYHFKKMAYKKVLEKGRIYDFIWYFTETVHCLPIFLLAHNMVQ